MMGPAILRIYHHHVPTRYTRDPGREPQQQRYLLSDRGADIEPSAYKAVLIDRVWRYGDLFRRETLKGGELFEPGS